MENEHEVKKAIDFKIICDKCGERAFLWEKFRHEYDISHEIRCEKCENTEEIFGVDG